MLAETAAWDWLKENKVEYDVVFTLPVFLFGVSSFHFSQFLTEQFV